MRPRLSISTLACLIGVLNFGGCTSSRDAQTRPAQSSGGVPSISVSLPMGGEDAPKCIGVVPTRITPEPTVGESIDNPTTPGAPKPNWTLKDVQPQSCGADKVYGLDAFDGQPLMVVLLWGGCGFCQAQAEKLQQMHYELRAEGVQVNFAIINMARGDTSFPENFIQRTYFPIFEDTSEVDAWGQMAGSKDDFYFYRSDGVLHNYLSITGSVDLVLSSQIPGVTADGYTNLKNAVLDLVKNDVQPGESAGGTSAQPEAAGTPSSEDVGTGGDSENSGGLGAAGNMESTGGIVEAAPAAGMNGM